MFPARSPRTAPSAPHAYTAYGPTATLRPDRSDTPRTREGSEVRARRLSRPGPADSYVRRGGRPRTRSTERSGAGTPARSGSAGPSRRPWRAAAQADMSAPRAERVARPSAR
ncbi:unnamed protein product, partial [Iphiclides podalirius]